jgi:hypothetical protein
MTRCSSAGSINLVIVEQFFGRVRRVFVLTFSRK